LAVSSHADQNKRKGKKGGKGRVFTSKRKKKEGYVLFRLTFDRMEEKKGSPSCRLRGEGGRGREDVFFPTNLLFRRMRGERREKENAWDRRRRKGKEKARSPFTPPGWEG